tara:strand:- start:334 stop:753 length:420 start_codon:yes stop_codon:yes gene_type:complete
MTHFQKVIRVETKGKGLHEITQCIENVLEESRMSLGFCHLYIQHTSASLLIQENADPDVQKDLEYFFEKLVPQNDLGYTHTIEGADDMPSHIRSAITKTSEQIPFNRGKLLLGTWQGIFLWEHRIKRQIRKIIIHIFGN